MHVYMILAFGPAFTGISFFAITTCVALGGRLVVPRVVFGGTGGGTGGGGGGVAGCGGVGGHHVLGASGGGGGGVGTERIGVTGRMGKGPLGWTGGMDFAVGHMNLGGAGQGQYLPVRGPLLLECTWSGTQHVQSSLVAWSGTQHVQLLAQLKHQHQALQGQQVALQALQGHQALQQAWTFCQSPPLLLQALWEQTLLPFLLV